MGVCGGDGGMGDGGTGGGPGPGDGPLGRRPLCAGATSLARMRWVPDSVLQPAGLDWLSFRGPAPGPEVLSGRRGLPGFACASR